MMRLGNAAVRLEGELAHLTLPGFDLESYKTYLKLKAALPRFEVKGRTLTTDAANLARLGLAAEGLSSEELLAAGPLFEDQRYVLGVALRRKRFAIYAECGWGKAITQLAFAREIAKKSGRKVLLVAPLQVVKQAIGEHAKFWPGEPLPANLRAWPGGVEGWLAHDGAPELGIVNVDAFRKPLRLPGLAGVVLDEASVLKQAAGILRNHLVEAARGVEYRLACSATPAPNDLEEYVSQALWVGAVRSHKEFFADYFSSDGEGGWSLRSYATEAFYDFMASWSIWIRDPATYGFPARLAEVPAPRFVDVVVPLTEAQEQAARPFRSKRNLFLDEVGIVKRGKLAQISRGFLYQDGKALPVPSHKPRAVADAVCSHPGERAVVWVAYNEEAEILRAELYARGKRVAVVSGETSDEARDAAVAGLETGNVEVLIAKPQTLGFGLNLQAASVCVFSGVSDSFERDYQALRRLFRFGQVRPVTCYYVITPFERPMLENLQRKRGLWLAQAEAMEQAYARAAGADLAVYRGETSPGRFRTRHELTPKDRAALAASRSW